MTLPEPTLFASILNPKDLISSFGTVGLIAVIFAESCFAFFLPGDSLLFTAGLVSASATQTYGMNVWVVAIGCSLAAILGNQVGYLLGRKAGPALFSRQDSRFFKREHLETTHSYFEHYGPKTILLARFVPVVRTFACIVAGIARMQYRVFLTYNVIGGVLWGGGVTALGWITAKTLGKAINVDHYLLPIVAIVIAVSFIPIIVEYSRTRKKGLPAGSPPSGHANHVMRDEIEPD